MLHDLSGVIKAARMYQRQVPVLIVGISECSIAQIKRRFDFENRRGAEISFQIDAADTVRSVTTVSTISSTSLGSQADRKRIDIGELLKSSCLASITAMRPGGRYSHSPAPRLPSPDDRTY